MGPRTSIIGQPEAIVFDLDGTIVDTETPEFEAIRAVWAAHGVEYEPRRFEQYIGTSTGTFGWLDELEKAAGRPIDVDSAVALRRSVHRSLVDALQARDGIVDLIEQAAAAGVPMAVASNSPDFWVRERLAALELSHRLPVVISSDTALRPKPWPEPFLQACSAIGADPMRSVAFEDSVTGVTAAVAAGLYTVACPNPLTRNHDLTAAHCMIDAHTAISLGDLGSKIHERLSARG